MMSLLSAHHWNSPLLVHWITGPSAAMPSIEYYLKFLNFSRMVLLLVMDLFAPPSILICIC
jgi:hypothetical protein